jgi:hypothetical protein
MFSGPFVAPTWDRYSSFALIWLIAHEKIQDLYKLAGDGVEIKQK